MAKRTNQEQNNDFSQKLTPQTFRQLNRLQLNAGRYLPGHAVGMRPSLRRRPSSEFKEHRMYVTGDDVRFVDWKASSRSEHVFVKLGEQPKEATVYILLDCSQSMDWGDPPKVGTALALAAAIGYMALSQGRSLDDRSLYRKDHQAFGSHYRQGTVYGFNQLSQRNNLFGLHQSIRCRACL